MEMNILEAVRIVNGYGLETVEEAKAYEEVTTKFFGRGRSLSDILADNEEAEARLLTREDAATNEIVQETLANINEVNTRIRKALKTLGS